MCANMVLYWVLGRASSTAYVLRRRTTRIPPAMHRDPERTRLCAYGKVSCLFYVLLKSECGYIVQNVLGRETNCASSLLPLYMYIIVTCTESVLDKNASVNSNSCHDVI